MNDPRFQLLRELECARRIRGGLTDPHSRRVLRDYIAELEARLTRLDPATLAA